MKTFLQIFKCSLAIVLLLLCACSGQGSQNSDTNPLRLGYFPNITHSQALVGLERGDFQQALGSKVTLEATAFNAGPAVIEALFAGKIDIAYIGPSPAINGWIKSKGKALKIIANACNGGASLILSDTVANRFPNQLANLRLASPQLGNTQDVALRTFLLSLGLEAEEKGGSVKVLPMENATIMGAFANKQIDGAWVPEPWASRLVLDSHGIRVLDERDLWLNKRFPSAVVIVSSTFLAEHPDQVLTFLAAHRQITQWEIEHPADAMALVNKRIKDLSGKAISEAVLSEAWSKIEPSWEIDIAALNKTADDAWRLGFLKDKPNLEGLIQQ